MYPAPGNESVPRFASYVRVSTATQDPERQLADIGERIDELGDVDDWKRYRDDSVSGADNDRPEFVELLRAVRAGEVDVVVMSEISRLARRNATAADFIDAAVEQGVPIHLTDDMLDVIEPDDPMSQFFAKFLSLWYEEERKATIRRVRSGLRQARSEGKWLGEVPAGFERDDQGFLQVDLDEYLAIADALESIEAGESYRSAARSVPVTRQTLSSIDKDDERRRWYLGGEADDDRVASALDVVNDC
jgi:DNA invertase Pin-like site-specific DNA recombinase